MLPARVAKAFSPRILSRVLPNIAAPLQALRFINLHEYQSKALMDKAGVNIQKFRVADTPEGIEKAAKELNTKELVMKAQVQAGGRGKGTFANGYKGGVQFPKTPKDAKNMAAKMLGQRLHTHQTGPEGVLCKKLMIAQSLPIARETYFAVLYDRASQGPILMGSPCGGMDIESVAAKTPEKIFTEKVDITTGPTVEQCKKMAKNLNFKGKLVDVAAQQMKKLYDLFLQVDATQVEVNPFGETPDGRVVSFDAKINLDESAFYRHEDIWADRDTAEEDAREVEAQKYGLNYIGLDGEIGCLVNGAGLAMATCDSVKLFGGSPANFLDVGGSATAETVAVGFRLITSDPKVSAIFVNIFGGIMKCDIIADGVVKATKTTGLKLPVVVRLQGTNVEQGKKILKESGLKLFSEDDMTVASKLVVKLSNEYRKQNPIKAAGKTAGKKH